ncbi:hypothetical protein BTR23_08865 [Alkalihalophilus pseudofirmus]|nr:hypothetical protein BTR23_08865 [Alkalihalophilus pseudofirmus]
MYYHRPYYPYYNRPEDYPYPPIDITFFEQSLQAYQILVQHGTVVINRLAASRELMYQLMYSAQAGDDDEVDRIIRATGVPTIVDTSYTPNSVTFTLYADADDFPQCCTLTMNLRWG